MSDNFLECIDSFASLRVGVIGEAMLDRYLEGKSTRLCREAPVPVVDLDTCEDVAGGAANTAVNLHALGAQVTLLSVTGRDAEADRLLRHLSGRGIAVDSIIVDPARRTLSKNRVVADSQLLVRYDTGDTQPIGRLTERSLICELRRLFETCDAIVISDYGYGILTLPVIHALEELQSAHSRLVVADSRNIAAYHNVGLTAVKPNYQEAAALLRLTDLSDPHDRSDFMEAHGDRLLAVSGARIAAVTLDTDGALILERGRPPYRTYAKPVAHSRATGAGDTFVSAFTLALAVGAETQLAAEIASAAAAIVVSKTRTAACEAEELRQHFHPCTKVIENVKMLGLHAANLHRQGLRLVFTNGCFDLLHRGHIAYLNQAKSLGDVLIVGVNSDDSVRRLKGPGRPINTLEDRIQVLAGLSSVDLIVPFDEDVPFRLVEAIRPHLYVKGGDYTKEALPEAAMVERQGGAVQILPFVEDRSTTRMIERICQLAS